MSPSLQGVQLVVLFLPIGVMIHIALVWKRHQRGIVPLTIKNF
jgi:hypothetical protein